MECILEIVYSRNSPLGSDKEFQVFMHTETSVKNYLVIVKNLLDGLVNTGLNQENYRKKTLEALQEPLLKEACLSGDFWNDLKTEEEDIFGGTATTIQVEEFFNSQEVSKKQVSYTTIRSSRVRMTCR